MLERKKAEKIRVAEVWRTYQSELVESFYAGDRQSADDDFIVRARCVHALGFRSAESCTAAKRN